MDSTFEDRLNADLYSYLTSIGAIDTRMPECIDLEDKWENIAKAYMPDGIREFNGYPVVALGWMMFVGMALAKFWDEDWMTYGQYEDLYGRLRDPRGFDYMDEYITEDVLMLRKEESGKTARIVAECASRTNSMLIHEKIEPGTTTAFQAFVSCLHQMYLMGIAMELKALGYHMTPVTIHG